MKFIYPKKYVPSIYEIDFKQLYADGYKGILFDVDNTLVAFDCMDAPDQLVEFITGLQKMGFEVGLVSNNTTARVAALNRKLNLEMMPNAMKPFTFRLKRILKEIGVAPDKAIFVGDQLFTDVWVGNSMGLYSILVEPIQKKEQLVTWVKRGIESLVLKGYKNDHR